MLDFLVKSAARRRLLLLLWGERAAASAPDFGEQTGVGFASAYRELQAMEKLDWVCSERRDGKKVYFANPSHPDADLLERLAKSRPAVIPADLPEDDEVRSQLRALGAPLAVKPSDKVDEPELTLVRAAKLAHRDATVARVLPVCVWKCRETLHAQRLVDSARELGEKQAVGLFLDLTTELTGDRRFRRWARSLQDHRIRAKKDFFHGSSHRALATLAEERTPRVARKWGFRMNMDLETFKSLFDKFVDLE